MTMKEETIKNSIQPLLHDPKVFDFIKKTLNSLSLEEEAFAADEVSAVGEDLILTLIGLGIQAYLNTDADDSEFNQFILEVLLGIRKAGSPAQFLAIVKKYLHQNLKHNDPFFIKIKQKLPLLSNEEDNPINYLQSQMIQFRNDLFHGIFIAPASRSREMAKLLKTAIESIFSDIEPIEISDKLPIVEGKILFPFFYIKGSEEKLSYISYENALERIYISDEDKSTVRRVFQNFGEFGNLYNSYLFESSIEFLESELTEASQLKNNSDSHGEIITRIKKGWEENRYPLLHLRGSYKTGKTSIWAHLTNSIKEDIERSHKNAINENTHPILISYRNREWESEGNEKKIERGVRFSNRFLIEHLIRELSLQIPEWKIHIHNKSKTSGGYSFDKKWQDIIKFYKTGKLGDKQSIKIPLTYVLIDDIHYRMGNENHILSLSRGLFDISKNLKFIGFSSYYPSLQYAFGSHISLDSHRKNLNIIPTDEVINEWIQSYIVDRGPYPDKNKILYETLIESVWLLVGLIRNNKDSIINLHKLSSSEGLNLAILEEASYILSPWINHGHISFEADIPTVNPLFIHKETEMTFPYHVIRRRDIKLEYQSPTITQIR